MVSSTSSSHFLHASSFLWSDNLHFLTLEWGGDFREKDLASLFKKYNCWFPKMENTTLPNLFCDWLWKYLELTWLWDYFGHVMILSTFQRDDIFPCWILFAGYQNATDMSKYSRTDGVNSLRIKKKKRIQIPGAVFFLYSSRGLCCLGGFHVTPEHLVEATVFLTSAAGCMSGDSRPKVTLV